MREHLVLCTAYNMRVEISFVLLVSFPFLFFELHNFSKCFRRGLACYADPWGSFYRLRQRRSTSPQTVLLLVVTKFNYLQRQLRLTINGLCSCSYCHLGP